MTMPEKIYCGCGDGLDENGALCVNCVHVLSIEIEALEAENKMLAGATKDLSEELRWIYNTAKSIAGVKRYTKDALKKHAEAIALAQRIGGK